MFAKVLQEPSWFMVSERNPTFDDIRRYVEAGNFLDARKALGPMLTEARSAVKVEPERLVEVLLLFETVVMAGQVDRGDHLREAIAICEEAMQVAAAADLDIRLRIAALARGATRYSLDGSAAKAVALIREAIGLATSEVTPKIDIAWLRTQLVADLLSAGDAKSAFVELESWPSWGIDELDLWLINRRNSFQGNQL